MVKILERFPQLKPKFEFSFASDPDTFEYLTDCSFLCTNQDSVEDIVQGCNPNLVLIVLSMLEVNPYFRPSCFELLQNPIFDSFRVKENEYREQPSMELEIDNGL